MEIDPDRVSGLIREVARRTVLPHFRTLRAAEVREKGPGDLVTVADVACERARAEALLAAYPGSAVLGEEAAAADPSIMRRLHGKAPLWVLDPIDGTINFAHGREGFAVIVALVIGGRTEAGFIHDPLAGETVAARHGGGAWSDGVRLRVTTGTPLAAMVGSAYGPGTGDIAAERALAAGGRVGSIANRLCGGVEYIDIAKGDIAKRPHHFMLSARSLPWDHAAGVLIVHEAGGVARFLDGSAYDPAIDDGRVLAAPDEASWRYLRDVIGTLPQPPTQATT
ncbi:MAG: inositol monophosphatase family protein [Alphaproteobacteria bacterium]